MSNIWFTSDSHYSHTNIAGSKVSTWKSGYRNFESVDLMNNTIVDNINSVIQSNDILYHLGDWSFGGKDKVKEFRDRLNVKTIHLIFGNHDHHIRKNNDLKRLFTTAQEVYSGKIRNRYFHLSHYSHLTWPYSDNKSIQLFAHSHGSLPDNPNLLSMDVGIDTCLFGHKKYFPYHYDEIISIMDNYKTYKPVDHHGALSD